MTLTAWRRSNNDIDILSIAHVHTGEWWFGDSLPYSLGLRVKAAMHCFYIANLLLTLRLVIVQPRKSATGTEIVKV